MKTPDRFARRIFLIAGIYGIVVLFPMYFMEGMIGRDYPPPITHPEHFYGFVGVALTWQVAFILIARDVRRHRLLMLPAVLEKLSFGMAAVILYFNGRADISIAVSGTVDLVLAVLFTLAFRTTGGWSIRVEQ